MTFENLTRWLALLVLVGMSPDARSPSPNDCSPAAREPR